MRTVPPYAFSRGQWILDKSDVIDAAQCVIRAIGPAGCGFIEWITLQQYGEWISTEQAKSDPYAAAHYVLHYGFYARICFWDEPSWMKQARACGGDEAAQRILGLIQPEPPRKLDPRRLP